MNITILILTDFNPFLTSGASANRWQGIIKILIQLGYKVIIFITKGKAVKAETKQVKNLEYHDICFIYLSHLPYYSLAWRRFFNLFGSFIEKAILKNAHKKIENILPAEAHALMLVKNSPEINKILISLKISKSLKLVTEVNEIPQLSLRPTKDYSLYVKNVIPKFDAIWSMTYSLLNLYSDIGLKADCQKRILPMSVDLSRFQIEPSGRFPFPYLFYCGTLNDGKDGVDILVESFGIIHKKYPSLRLVLAGWYFEKMLTKQKSIIKEYGIEDKVIYTGEVQREDIPALMKAAKILCLARPDSVQAKYGFPTKLGEYLAAKRPVCVTSVGEIPLYLKDKTSAVITVPRDAKSFARGLEYLLENEERAEIIANKGYEVAQNNFSIVALKSHIGEYIKDIMNKSESK